MENRLKKFLFNAVVNGKIIKFTSHCLELECFGSKITVSWTCDDPTKKMKYHNLHDGISICSGNSLGITASVGCYDTRISGSKAYKVTFENDLSYNVPMTVVESDQLTAILSEAFQKYQKRIIDSTINHWELYSAPDAFDDLLEDPKHVE